MSVDGDFFRFSDGELVSVETQHTEALTVADSFLVSDGSVRGLSLHETRFAESIERLGYPAGDLDGFFLAARRLMPKTGQWFPRFEYRSESENGKLFFRLRPSPTLTDQVTLWTYPEPDPRRHPLIKGPDLSLCQQLRRAANLHGADEAVLLDEDGFIADGALSSIVWWRGDTLLGPDSGTPWLPSITRKLVFELALQAGFSTGAEMVRPVDITGCEVWSLSALQGIRQVIQWEGLALTQTQRVQSFRKRLSLLASPA